MITDLIVGGNVGFFATDHQFVLIIKGKIYGPFKNKDYQKVIDALKKEEEN